MKIRMKQFMYLTYTHHKIILNSKSHLNITFLSGDVNLLAIKKTIFHLCPHYRPNIDKYHIKFTVAILYSGMYADKTYHQILQCSLPLSNGISECLQCTLPIVTGNICIAFHMKYANITVSAKCRRNLYCRYNVF
jgi:hypothetical protein